MTNLDFRKRINLDFKKRINLEDGIKCTYLIKFSGEGGGDFTGGGEGE